MSNSNLHTQEFKSVVSNRLNAASVKTQRIAIPLKHGTKECTIDFTRQSNRRNISQNIGNYGILAQGRLHFIDLDDKSKVTDKLLKNTQDTFSVSTPSKEGEHRYVVSDTPLPNIKRNWGEIRSDNQYVVGPGSSIPDYGSYDIQNDAPIQEVTKDELGNWIDGWDNDPEEEGFSEDIELDSLGGSERLATAQEILKQLQNEHTPFFQDLSDRLNGGRGKMDESLSKESGKINTSRLDFVTLEHLYGIFREYGKSHSESRGLAGATYSHYSSKTPFTKDGQKRKWEKRGKQYKFDMIDNAIQSFDQSQFLRLLNQSNGSRRDLNEYSDITFNFVSFIVEWKIEEWDSEQASEFAKVYNLDIDMASLEVVRRAPMYQDTPRGLSEGKECEYPSPRAIRNICSELDKNGEETYRRVMKKMRKNGEMKLACLEDGVDYRVYPPDLPDPAEAEWVRCNGERSEVV